MAANKWAIMGGVALNVEYTRKYAFDATAAAKVTAKLVAVPPPGLFQEAVQADIVGRMKRAAALTAPVVQPTTVLPRVITPPITRLPPQLPPTATLDEDEEFSTLSLIVEDKAGLGYTLDDGVTPPSAGQVAEDGTLIHRVSKRSAGCVITFEDGSEPVELTFEDSADEEEDDNFDESPEDWAEFAAAAEEAVAERAELEDETDEVTDDEETEALIDSWVDDDERTLSLMIPEHAGKPYTLDDSVNISQGVIAEDGLLIHPISPEALGCTIEIEGEPEKIELTFSGDDDLE